MPGDVAIAATLPESTDMVIAVHDLARLRQSRGLRAMERFLSELSTWESTTAAWREVSKSLDLADDAALDALAGQDVVVCVGGMGAPDRPAQRAVLTRVSKETEALLRAKLRPAPRGVEQAQPVLALESGAFEVATSPWSGDNASACVLMAPRGSGEFFDALLPVAAGNAKGPRLGGTTAWARAMALPEAPILVVYRDDKPGQEAEFLAMRATVADDTLDASYTASETMLLAPGSAEKARAWPTAAVDMLERDATLMVAGSPDRQARRADESGVVSLGGGVQSTLLLTLLSNLNLPSPLKAKIAGVALIAVHRNPAGSDPGALSITGAIPTADLASFKVEADRWVVSLAGDPDLHLPQPAPGEVPVLVLGDAASPILPGVVHAGGSLAWTFAPAAEGPGGWWVLNIRTASGDEARAGSSVRELAQRLSAPGDAKEATLYRLVLRPADLADITRRRVGDESAGASRSRSESAFRWIERVETRMVRTGPGEVGGTLAIRVSGELLRGAAVPAK